MANGIQLTINKRYCLPELFHLPNEPRPTFLEVLYFHKNLLKPSSRIVELGIGGNLSGQGSLRLFSILRFFCDFTSKTINFGFELCDELV